MKNHAWSVSALLVALATQAACKKPMPDASATDAGPTATSATIDAGASAKDAAKAEREKEKAADEKLDGLVDCLNDLDSHLHKDLGIYASRLPPEKKDGTQPGPTGKEDNIWVAELSDSTMKSCEKELDAAKDDAAYTEVVTRYRAAVDKLVPVYQQLRTYYDQKDWKDDKYVKGKELHATLWPLATDFMVASKSFRELVVKTNDARSAKEIADVEKTKGRNLEFQQLNLMKEAKNAVKIAADEKATLADLETVLASYEKAKDETTAYVSAHPDEIGSLSTTTWNGLIRSADDYLKVLKDRVRRVRDKTKYSAWDLDHLESVDGSGAKVNEQYNKLVADSNRL